MIDFFAVLIGVILVAAPSWVLGWHYGARSFRDRTRKFKKAIEESDYIYTRWSQTSEGKDFELGYKTGTRDVLNTLAAFLDRAEVKDAPPHSD